MPENDLSINPVPADGLGIKNGEYVNGASSVGSGKIKARVTEEIRPDCVFMLHGFGKKSKMQSLVYNVGASDAVILETAWDKVSGNAAFHGTFVKVSNA
jgi:thiosulfate reductase/polysulfide reductase chain A